jgi:trehalose synthase
MRSNRLVGGIQDQIEPGVSGLLVEPRDPTQLGTALTTLLDDQDGARAMGAAARTRVSQLYLAPHHLDRYFRLILDLVSAD